MGKGVFISFEGLDGAGKTTQMDLLAGWLDTSGRAYLRTREPGGTPLGIELRNLLLNRPDLATVPLAEAFLFQADRAQHFASMVLPALANGTIVITDRCFDSSIAYQGVARGLGVDLIERLSLIATQGHAPDLTILLDLEPEQVQMRTDLAQDQQRIQQTHFDKEEVQFHQRLRRAYLALAQAYPKRIKVINAAQSSEAIHQEIVRLVARLLEGSDA